VSKKAEFNICKYDFLKAKLKDKCKVKISIFI
jgi:hypothetical protein